MLSFSLFFALHQWCWWRHDHMIWFSIVKGLSRLRSKNSLVAEFWVSWCISICWCVIISSMILALWPAFALSYQPVGPSGREQESLCLLTVRSHWVHSRVWHPDLHSLPHSLLHSYIMAEPLPLRVDWVDTAAWEDITFFDKALPVDLIFVFLAGVCRGDLEDLD